MCASLLCQNTGLSPSCETTFTFEMRQMCKEVVYIFRALSHLSIAVMIPESSCKRTASARQKFDLIPMSDRRPVEMWLYLIEGINSTRWSLMLKFLNDRITLFHSIYFTAVLSADRTALWSHLVKGLESKAIILWKQWIVSLLSV